MTNEMLVDLPRLERIMHRNQRKGTQKIDLFLDFDGVINVFYREGTPEYEKKYKEAVQTMNFADQDCVHRLDRFCQDYPVQVIISSSWRLGSLQNCIDYLKDAGLKNETAITDTTQTEVFQSRQEDISQYLIQHRDYSGFLIFDDLDMPELGKYLVHTDPYQGWNEERDAFARNIVKKF